MRYFRQLTTLAAAALVGTTMIAATADAQTPGGYYVATPVAQPAKSTVITRSTAWSRKGTTYVAARGSERDSTLCQMVARKTGGLDAFTVAGKAFDADQLAKCNGSTTRAGSAAVVAR